MKRWYWGVWIIFFIVSFGVMEGIAIQTGTPTLSRTVWDAQTAFPLLEGLFCFVIGGLVVHFFWTNQGPPI